MLAWSAHLSLVRNCCSLGTSLSISNNTITLYRRELSLNTRRMTVIGAYSSKLYTVYIACWFCVNHCSSINQHSIDSLRQVLRWSHAPLSKLANKMDFCSFHVSLAKICVYFHTWEANRQCFHKTEMQCTSFKSAVTHCLSGKLYHTFWRLEELLNISTSI